MVKEHKIDFVLHDEPGRDLAGFGGITFGINQFDLEGNLFAELLDVDTAVPVDLSQHPLVDPRRSLPERSQRSGGRIRSAD